MQLYVQTKSMHNFRKLPNNCEEYSLLKMNKKTIENSDHIL